MNYGVESVIACDNMALKGWWMTLCSTWGVNPTVFTRFVVATLSTEQHFSYDADCKNTVERFPARKDNVALRLE